MSVPVNKLVAVYIKMRDRRDKLRKEYDDADAKLVEQMDVVTAELLAACESVGANSLRTDAGTVVRWVKTRYWSSDWESLHAFIRENDALNLLEGRIHQTNMRTFLEENPEMRPPGLNADSEYVITVRRK